MPETKGVLSKTSPFKGFVSTTADNLAMREQKNMKKFHNGQLTSLHTVCKFHVILPNFVMGKNRNATHIVIE